MIKLKSILESISTFDNWVVPNQQALSREYRVEHEMKGRDWWPTEEAFLDAVANAKPTVVTKSMDARISNRSRTSSKGELLDLIKGYASYPKYRNSTTLSNIYKAFEQNQPMEMPIVVKNGRRYEVMAGNTRMDVAFQMGINPTVLLVNAERPNTSR